MPIRPASKVEAKNAVAWVDDENTLWANRLTVFRIVVNDDQIVHLLIEGVHQTKPPAKDILSVALTPEAAKGLQQELERLNPGGVNDGTAKR